ncbi:MAG TPA: transposase [Terriglobales bacterium]|nr:transposase [Terriglobales bacterium]
MPKEFWAIFQQNRGLANDLPALAAGIMESAMRAKHGIRIGVIAILHTCNGPLEFNSHVHTMVTAGGLHEPSGTRTASAFYNRDQLTELWRASVIRLIRTAYGAGRLKTDMTFGQLEAMLTHWEHRWWSVRIQSFESREHFLRYAGRYVRRPPIAQRRILRIGRGGVTFWIKDKKLGRVVAVQHSLKEFIDLWIQQIPARYRHAMRYFGLFAPRAVSQTSAAVFAIVGQRHRQRPKCLHWADSIKRDFGWDPLLDRNGQKMHWVRRIAPIRPTCPASNPWRKA